MPADSAKVAVTYTKTMPGLTVAYYQNFDVIIYWNSFAYDATNALASGVPFITYNLPHAQGMNIASAAPLHQFRQEFCVHDNGHYPTAIFPTGTLLFDQPMWTDGATPSGAGIGLVADICLGTGLPLPQVDSSTFSHLKGLYADER